MLKRVHIDWREIRLKLNIYNGTWFYSAVINQGIIQFVEGRRWVWEPYTGTYLLVFMKLKAL